MRLVERVGLVLDLRRELRRARAAGRPTADLEAAWRRHRAELQRSLDSGR